MKIAINLTLQDRELLQGFNVFETIKERQSSMVEEG